MTPATDIEHRLLAHPDFGDPSSILARMRERIDSVARNLEPRLRDYVSHATLNDPVFRHALWDLTTNGNDAEPATKLLDRMERSHAAGPTTLAGEEENPKLIHGENGDILLYTPHRGDFHDLYQRQLDSFTQADRPHMRIKISQPTPKAHDQIKAAVDLLRSLFPTLGPKTLRFVGMITLIDTGGSLHSGIVGALPGAVMIDHTVLDNTALTAELLFHEALHTKLDAIAFTRRISPALYSSEAKTLITAVWHSGGADGTANQWPIHQALSSFHVYSHMVFLADAMTRTDHHRSYAGRLQSAALFRALYLGHELLRLSVGQLPEDGQRLASWLLSLLPTSDTLSPAERYLIHNGVGASSDSAPEREQPQPHWAGWR